MPDTPFHRERKLRERAAAQRPAEIAFRGFHPGQVRVLRQAKRFNVLACGRRWGKTLLGSVLCVQTAGQGGFAWWVAPTYKMSGVGWRRVKAFAAGIPGCTVREGDHEVRFPGGGTLQVRSATDPDSLRGEGLDRVVIDEAVYLAERAWSEALRPALADKRGDAWFISSPHGNDWFHRLWSHGQDALYPDWASWQMPTRSNPHIPPEEIEAAKELLPERVFQQEFLAQFLEDSGGVFRGVRQVIDAGRKENEKPTPNGAYTLGVDLARVEDFTVLTVLDSNGRQVYHDRFNQISWELQISRILDVARRYGARCIIDSTGVGDPIFEQVRKAGIRTLGYNLSAGSKERLIDGLAIAIEQQRVRLLDLPVQTAELQNYQYELTPSRNVRMNAPAGMHDDCVIALALAVEGLKTRVMMDGGRAVPREQ